MSVHNLPPSLTHEWRAYVWEPCAGACFDAVLYIVQGEGPKAERDNYAVCEMTEAGELASDLTRVPVRRFLVARVDGNVPERIPDVVEDDGREWLYCVTCYRPGESDPRFRGNPGYCGCYGFNRWNTCKHVDCLSDLLKRGEL